MRPVATLGVLLLLTAGCGDPGGATAGDASEGTDATSTTESTTDAATTTTADATGSTSDTDGPSELEWSSCHGTFECATLVVPIERADPALGTAEIRVIRRAPEGASKGTIVLIPGGPGDSGVTFARDRAALINAQGWTAVGFDARGVDDSSAVVCGDDDAADALVALDTTPDDASERAALDAVAGPWVAACVANTDPALLGRVDSAHAADDLERLREALGEDQLNAIAVSYGARIVLRYAAAYPDRVRAIALDSPTGRFAKLAIAVPIWEPTLELEHQLTADIAGYQGALERFWAWSDGGCDGAAVCFHAGEGVAQVQLAFNAVWDQLETLDLGRAADRAVLIALSQARWDDLAAALVALEGGSANELLSLYVPLAPGPDGTYPNFFAARGGVWFADHVVSTPPAFTGADFDALVAEVAAQVGPEAGRFVTSEAPYFLAGNWSVAPAAEPVAYGPLVDAPPLLVIAGSDDPRASAQNVLDLVTSLGNGSHAIVIEREGHAPLGEACVVDLVAAFVEDPSAVPNGDGCAPG